MLDANSKKVALTEEQEVIANSALDVPVTVVRARAGTGKSTTIRELAARNPSMKGAYLCYNTANAIDASRRNPSNLVPSTLHKAAYKQTGVRYQHKLTKRDIRKRTVLEVLGIAHDYERAGHILETVKWYCCSSADAFPDEACAVDGDILGSKEYLSDVAAQAKHFWSLMCDTRSEVPMTFDGYLKLFALGRPRLPFDFICLDEGQDSNAMTIAMLLDQRCPIVLVGDEHQAIYQFRGASDLFERVVADRQFHLTGSFRFGPRIGRLASTLLATFKGDSLPIQGLGPNTMIGDIHPRLPRTLICRTNAEVFFRASTALELGYRVGFVGGVAKYEFDSILNAYYLFARNRTAISDNWIRSFASFEQFEEHAYRANDIEGVRHCKTVRAYGDAIPDLIRALKEDSEADLGKAERVFSTAHKCKGFDINNVTLGEDFCALVKDGHPIQDPLDLPTEEINLTYVALTRAVDHLTLNATLLEFCETVGLQFS